MQLPADWQGLCNDWGGQATFVRRFQRPTNLEPDERVCVTLVEARCAVRCYLNGNEVSMLRQPLGDSSCWPSQSSQSFDVTNELQTSNLLELEVCWDASATNATGLHEPVLLEIVMLDDDD